MSETIIYDYSTPIGVLRLQATDTVLCSAIFIDNTEACYKQINEVITKVISQLDEYLAGKRQDFNIPLHASGTKFQEQVWGELQKIPYGETISYSQLAERIDNPKAVRAVGNANGRNPITIIIPCHRVIGKGGKLRGYAYGEERKQWLLHHESKQS